MLRILEARRQRVLRELAYLNREIAATQQRLAEIQLRMSFLNPPPKTKAA
jgi:hypothetical protein